MKIATWNVNSIKVRLPQVLTWLDSAQPDILALQELKVTNENFPEQAILEAGYQVVYAGQKTYNGVAILSRHSAQAVLTDIPTLVDPQRRILVASIGDVRVINLYVPNGQSIDSPKFAYKLDWLAKVGEFIQQQLTHHPRLVVLGDFNIAPMDQDVHDPAAWEGSVLVSEPERQTFADWLALGLVDSFRLFDQAERSFSWWDYRQLAFRRNRGLRIDHILVSQALVSQCRTCYIDKEPRRWERPSDHTLVVAEFDE
ncbi:MAG: exodeoxyribonuclease III [Legionellales bacterium]|nr:exodeoxyribonuclease III [Legionellales bacterium]